MRGHIDYETNAGKHWMLLIEPYARTYASDKCFPFV